MLEYKTYNNKIEAKYFILYAVRQMAGNYQLIINLANFAGRILCWNTFDKEMVNYSHAQINLLDEKDSEQLKSIVSDYIKEYDLKDVQ